MKHANISLFVPHLGCPHQCSFCNQKTISGAVEPLSPEKVNETLQNAVSDGVDPENTEIAFFGGSFTAIERDYMLSLLDATKPFLEEKKFCGIRISTRPDAINDEILTILKDYGVTSIELGAQSTDDEVLSFNNRGHSREDIIKASALIKAYGFSLGLQMMTGLYRSTDEKDYKTAADIVQLKPDTVRIYPTITLEGTYLGELYKSGEYKPQSIEAAASVCAKLLKLFYDNNINVIRLGLHSGGNVEDGYLAGPYHPAFGELCEGEIYLSEAVKKLENIPAGEIIIYVSPTEISKMTGQGKRNKAFLEKMGYIVKIKQKNNLKKYQIETEIKRKAE